MLLTPTETQIVEHLTEQGRCSLAQAVVAMGLSKSSLHQAFKTLVDKNVVVEEKQSTRKVFYQLAPKRDLERYLDQVFDDLRELFLQADTTEKPRVVFTDSFRLQPEDAARLQHFYEITTFDKSPVRVGDDLFLERSNGHEIVVRNDMGRIDEKYLQANPLLQTLTLPVIRPQNIDWKACKKHNVDVLHFDRKQTVTYCKQAQIEYVISAIFHLLRPLHLASAEVRKGIFDYREHVGEQLQGKKVGLWGCLYGSELVALLRALGCEVVVVNSNADIESPHDVGVARFHSSSEALGQVDIAVFADDYQNLDMDGLLEQSGSLPTYLVVASETILYTSKVLASLVKSRQIIALVIDSFPEMYVQDPGYKNYLDDFHELLSLPQVTITPGVWGYNKMVYANSSRYVSQILRELVKP